MRRIPVALLVSLMFGGSALAAERGNDGAGVTPPCVHVLGHGWACGIDAYWLREAVHRLDPQSAAEAPVFKPHCAPLDKLTADHEGAKITRLSIGQFHFVEGFYAASPITPPGVPPGDGALLLEIDGHPSIIWTRGKKEACITVIALGGGHGVYMPMPITADQLAALKAVHTGRFEERPVAPSDKPVKGELDL